MVLMSDMRVKKSQPGKFLKLILGVSLVFLFLVPAWFFLGPRRVVLDRVNLVLADSQGGVGVLSFDNEKAFFLSLPSQEKIVLTRGFGEYEIGKVFPLGELNQKGGVLLQESLQEFYAIGLAGYLACGQKVLISELDSKDKLVGVFSRALKGGIRTQRSKWNLVADFFRLFLLKKTDYTFAKVEDWLGTAFKDKVLRKESLAIAVLNATDHSGLANKAAKILDNAGARVVRIDSANYKTEQCSIMAGEEAKKSYTFSWLKAIFPCAVGETADDNRADLTLLLGEDYWKMLSEKW